MRVAASAVVLPSGVIGPAAVDIEGDRIAAVTPVASAPDRVLAPGFVDLQVNGIDDIDVASASGADWDQLERRVLAQGVTTWCPTLVTAPIDRYGPALERIAAAAARSPLIAGAHLEGPFLGGAPGAHRRDWMQALSLDWLAGLPPVVRIMTLAPELAGAVDCVRLLVERGALVSLGHSTATYEEAEAAVEAGARLVTHLFNGMGPLHHRSPGLVGAALSDDRLTTSVIADFVHVHPAAIAAAFRAKGPGRVVLVTDRVAAAEAGGAPRLADGTLAGSVLTMDGAVRNVVGQCGVSLADAVLAASTTPARLIGLADRGRIEPGARADLVALTPEPDLTVEQVWVGGVPAG